MQTQWDGSIETQLCISVAHLFRSWEETFKFEDFLRPKALILLRNRDGNANESHLSERGREKQASRVILQGGAGEGSRTVKCKVAVWLIAVHLIPVWAVRQFGGFFVKGQETADPRRTTPGSTFTSLRPWVTERNQQEVKVNSGFILRTDELKHWQKFGLRVQKERFHSAGVQPSSFCDVISCPPPSPSSHAISHSPLYPEEELATLMAPLLLKWGKSKCLCESAKKWPGKG